MSIEISRVPGKREAEVRFVSFSPFCFLAFSFCWRGENKEAALATGRHLRELSTRIPRDLESLRVLS